MQLKENDYAKVSDLSVYETKIMVCGLSRFYLGHVAAIIVSKTEKRNLVADVIVIIAKILYF